MEKQGFFGMLFDMSFSEFVTTRVIKFLFILGVLIAALSSLGIIVSGFREGLLMGLFLLVVSPAIFLLYVLFARIWCEIIIVIFRIAENTSRMVGQGKPYQQ